MEAAPSFPKDSSWERGERGFAEVAPYAPARDEISASTQHEYLAKEEGGARESPALARGGGRAFSAAREVLGSFLGMCVTVQVLIPSDPRTTLPVKTPASNVCTPT